MGRTYPRKHVVYALQGTLISSSLAFASFATSSWDKSYVERTSGMKMPEEPCRRKDECTY